MQLKLNSIVYTHAKNSFWFWGFI